MSDVSTQTKVANSVLQLTTGQKEIELINEAVAQLKAAGEELFADQIAALEQRAAAINAKIEAENITVIQEMEKTQQSFIRKYGQAAAHTVEIVLLATILGKLIGTF